MSTNQSKSPGATSTSTSTTSQKTAQSGPISVEIRGQRLTIRSDRDPEFVRRLARHIDETIEEIHEAAPAAPANKLLMLASMTVAEELFETREELAAMKQQLEETTDTMFELIDQVEEV